MKSFGAYKVTETLTSSRGTVMYKGNNGTSDAIIKVFHLAHFADGDMGRVQELSKWFYRTVEMQNRVAEKSPYLAPVLLYGIEGEAAWEVTKVYSGSVQKVIDTRSFITAENFLKIIEAVVQGALDLKEAYGRSHGNIKPSNVLFAGDQKAKITDVVLTDPAPGDGAQSLQFEANDLRSIGELIYRLVTRRRDEETVPMPAVTSPEWPAILGQHADAWLTLCNRLLDPSTIGGTYSLERLALDLLKFKQSGRKSPVLLIGAAAAAAVVIGAGIFVLKSGKNKTSADTRTSEIKIVKVVDTEALRAQEAAAKKSAEEAKRLGEEKRLAEQRAAAEAKARDEALKKAEAEAKRLAESARTEERQKAEAEAKRLAEEKRLADERAARESRLREEALKKAEAEAKRLGEEKRLAEERAAKLLAEEKRLAEEREARARREAELKAAEIDRLRKEAEKMRATEQAKARELAAAILKQNKETQAAVAKAADPAVLTPALFKSDAVVKARRGQKWVNTLGMRFVPVGDGTTLFCVWETRRKDFEQFVESAAYNGNQSWKSVSFPQTALDPVVNISPADASAFCAWLTKTEAQKGLIESRQFYRLPTDVEWAVASETPSSGDARLPFAWGNDWPPPAGAGNFPTTFSYDRFDHTAPVAQFRPNANGIYDLFGNVWELCTQGGGQDSYFGRGGSWQTASPDQMAASFHLPLQPSERREDVGFRCVLDLGK